MMYDGDQSIRDELREPYQPRTRLIHDSKTYQKLKTYRANKSSNKRGNGPHEAMNVFKWIRDRLLERSSKIWVTQVLGLLVILNVISPERNQAIQDTIGAGQEVYEEVADTVAAKIEFGQEKIEEGKAIVKEAKDTGLRLRDVLTGFWVMVLSAFGIATKDAKQGREYDAREDKLATALQKYGGNPRELLPDLPKG